MAATTTGLGALDYDPYQGMSRQRQAFNTNSGGLGFDESYMTDTAMLSDFGGGKYTGGGFTTTPGLGTEGMGWFESGARTLGDIATFDAFDFDNDNTSYGYQNADQIPITSDMTMDQQLAATKINAANKYTDMQGQKLTDKKNSWFGQNSNVIKGLGTAVQATSLISNMVIGFENLKLAKDAAKGAEEDRQLVKDEIARIQKVRGKLNGSY